MEAGEASEGSSISGTEALEIADREILGRCFVGHFDGEEIPKQTVVQKWVQGKWGNTIGAFRKTNYQILFEYPSRKMVEHTLIGDWKWQEEKSEVNLVVTIIWAHSGRASICRDMDWSAGLAFYIYGQKK